MMAAENGPNSMIWPDGEPVILPDLYGSGSDETIMQAVVGFNDNSFPAEFAQLYDEVYCHTARDITDTFQGLHRANPRAAEDVRALLAGDLEIIKTLLDDSASGAVTPRQGQPDPLASTITDIANLLNEAQPMGLSEEAVVHSAASTLRFLGQLADTERFPLPTQAELAE